MTVNQNNVLHVIDKKTGLVHQVRKYTVDGTGECSVWCDSWYGRHVLGQDCYFIFPKQVRKGKAKEFAKEMYDKVYSLVYKGYNISTALDKLGIDRNLFYKTATVTQKQEIYNAKKLHTKYGVGSRSDISNNGVTQKERDLTEYLGLNLDIDVNEDEI